MRAPGSTSPSICQLKLSGQHGESLLSYLALQNRSYATVRAVTFTRRKLVATLVVAIFFLFVCRSCISFESLTAVFGDLLGFVDIVSASPNFRNTFICLMFWSKSEGERPAKGEKTCTFSFYYASSLLLYLRSSSFNRL